MEYPKGSTSPNRHIKFDVKYDEDISLILVKNMKFLWQLIIFKGVPNSGGEKYRNIQI